LMILAFVAMSDLIVAANCSGVMSTFSIADIKQPRDSSNSAFLRTRDVHFLDREPQAAARW
jgi:hypothetical protein